MKKILSLFLALVMTFLLGAQTFAFNAEDMENTYPIIIVAGYGSTSLYAVNEDGSHSHAWGIEMDKIVMRVLARIVDVAIGIGKLTKGDAKYIADVVGGEFVKMFENLRCNPDGTSAHDVRRYCNTAADSNYAYLYENEDGKYLFEPEIMAMYGSYLGEDWKEYIFNFNPDFRMGAIDCAAELDSYVDEVLEYTGAEKVNLYCVSHGGQIGATYLNLYGVSDADKLNNVIITVPAIGGAGIAYDFFSRDIDFGEENLMYFIENGMMFETDIHWLFAEENLDFLDDILYYFLPYANEILGYWGSMWDFVPAKEYDKIKEQYLDPVENAEIIAKSDRFHYEVYPQMSERLQACIDSGINVYILAGCGSNDIAGYNVNSDSIIPTSSATGAVCAPYGQRFEDGYQPLCTVCKDKTHRHVSPDMEIDASTAYLPEQTWFVDGLYHGMTIKSKYCEALITELMFKNNLHSVYTCREFPQFHADTNRCQSVTAYFDNSTEGYVSAEDTKLIVKNVSEKYKVKLVSVSCDRMDIKFDNSFMTEIPVGGKTEISFKGEIPDINSVLTQVTVNYILVGSVTPFGARTLDFTICNTDPVESSGNSIIDIDKNYDCLLTLIMRFIPSLAAQKITAMFYNAVKALILSV